MRALALALVVALASGCLYVRYVAQGAAGQLDLLGRARPIEDVIKDPDTPLRVAVELAEIPAIKQYGRSYGLSIKKNYTKFVWLPEDRRAATVWFVGAADPLQFKPVPWCFPIAGCFPGLGWFDEDEAVHFKQQLDAKGLDAVVRPASAYSTGGWFQDPVTSSMLGGGDDALPYLANTILHESVHATVFIADEQFFNESLAEYIADALTDHWIQIRFGPGSPEDVAWTLGQALSLPRTARILATYHQLAKLYETSLPRDQKLAKKAQIIDELVADLHLRKRPNNATLNEAKLYNGGADALRAAHMHCGDIAKLIAAAKHLRREDFTKTLQDDLKPIGVRLSALCDEQKLIHAH
ncbi:MAG TPA: aminopeptidase [Kofleriaceae bacterium]|nr:aminopeptidase [Kofleriaceae bacterium]